MDTAYDPNRLLNYVIDRLGLKNDAALARTLEVQPPVISKIRHLRTGIAGGILLRIHEVSGLSLESLQEALGNRRKKYRLSSAQGRPKSR